MASAANANLNAVRETMDGEYIYNVGIIIKAAYLKVFFKKNASVFVPPFVLLTSQMSRCH